jgi:YggT family protein
MIPAFGQLLMLLLDICFWIIIIQVVLSWLIVFNVVNISNPQARNFVALIDKVTAPVYGPLRKIIPPIAGFDLTPIVVIFGIYLAKELVARMFF